MSVLDKFKDQQMSERESGREYGQDVTGVGAKPTWHSCGLSYRIVYRTIKSPYWRLLFHC